MSERVAIYGAAPSFVAYKTKTGGALSAPLFVNLGGGLYGFTVPDDQVAEGVVYVVATGLPSPDPAYACGAVFGNAAPFAAFLFTDFTGALWAGSGPSIARYVDFSSGVPKTAPSLNALASYLYTMVPPAEDVAGAAAYVVAGPAGATELRYYGAFSLTWGATGVTLGELIYSALAGDGTVTALIGTRIFPNRRPQTATLPLAVYNIISDVPANSLDGVDATTLTATRLQVDAYAKTYKEAHQVAKAIDNVLANLNSPDMSAVRDTKRDTFDNETQLHRVSTDYWVSR